MGRRPAGRGPERGREQGLSLVELLVSMLVLGIVTAMVTGLYVSTMRSVSYAQNLSANTRSVGNGMNEMSRVIRAATDNPVSGVTLSAPALEIAKDESVTFYAYVNLGTPLATQPPIKVQLSLDTSRRLVETTYAAVPLAAGYYSFSSTPESSRLLTETIAPAGTPSLFSYLKSDGTAWQQQGAATRNTTDNWVRQSHITQVLANLPIANHAQRGAPQLAAHDGYNSLARLVGDGGGRDVTAHVNHHADDPFAH